MTTKLTKWAADDGTEFRKKGDAEVYPAFRAALMAAIQREEAETPQGAMLPPESFATAAVELLKRFDIKAKG